MHINSHFAIGIIIGSLLHSTFNFTLLEFLLIVLLSFICDFDVFFAKYAVDHNHRMLITHSIFPSLLFITFGIIFLWPAVIFSGLTYSIHIIVDTFDWGTNFFYFQKKQIGLKLLISKEEFENLPKFLSEFKKAESFFDLKYYKSKTSLSIEAILFILMMVFITFFAIDFILVSFFYFIGLYFHLSRHFLLRKIERQI